MPPFVDALGSFDYNTRNYDLRRKGRDCIMHIGEILLFTMNSIMPLILLILLGYLLKRIGFFTKEFLKIGNKTVFYVCLPVLLFKNIADIEDLSVIRPDVIGYVGVVIAALLVIGFLTTLTVVDPRQKGVLHQCIFRSNFALIGVPLAELIGGAAGVRMAAILSLFTIPIFNISGVVVLSVYKGKGVKIDKKKILRDILTNPLIIGIFAGFLFALVRMQISDSEIWQAMSRVTFFSDTISFVARSATPLALLVLGGQFDFQKISGYRKPLMIGVTGRNVIAPLIGVGLAGILVKIGYLNFEPDVFAALIALFGTPVAVSSAIMAEAMQNDGQLAAQLVVWTSLVSVVSLFAVIAISRACSLL